MARRKVPLSPVSLADADVTDSGGKDTNEEEIEENGDRRPQKKLAKKTVVKVASKSKINPKHKLQPCGRWFNVLNNVRLNKKKTAILGWPPCSSQRGKGTSYS